MIVTDPIIAVSLMFIHGTQCANTSTNVNQNMMSYSSLVITNNKSLQVHVISYSLMNETFTSLVITNNK